MIPSVVAAEVEEALRDFLVTSFSPSNPSLASLIEDFANDRENFVKGPYLSVSLPFQAAPEGGEPFPEIPLGYTPYRHQRLAFERLGARRSTIVATGTGSGKTECFLWPILDGCRVRAGEPGIKAILIYPMNALATDQARRIAETIHRTPSLKDRITAGLFIGQSAPDASSRMTPERVIENRGRMLESPPDILLTNYKMLDYLLVRPRDQRLWRLNGPGTLNWLVIDELHTFDGAQGTDLACLVRRLKARLQVPKERLTCIGTSATLGSEAKEPELARYASRIFGEPFEPGAIVREIRQGIDEFLGATLISTHLLRPAGHRQETPCAPASVQEYIRSMYEVFFGEPAPESVDAPEWRCQLAERLSGHSSFVNLLRVLDGQPKPLREIVRRLRKPLQVESDQEALGLLDGLCALISVARRNGGAGAQTQLRPFLQVGVHLWARELGRMVCSVHEGADQGAESAEREGGESLPPEPAAAGNGSRAASGPILRRLRHSDDLGAEEQNAHLPLVQCRECRATGWTTLRGEARHGMDQDLRRFYNRFFSRDRDVCFLFPDAEPPLARSAEATLCGRCGALEVGARKAGEASTCKQCGLDRTVRVFIPDAAVVRGSGAKERVEVSPDCPYCGAKHSLLIVGARSTVLLSETLDQTYASRYNDDPKVIAFSDNVQDAAHRAGFFAARTWKNVFRARVAQVVAENDGIALQDLPAKVAASCRASAASSAAFVSEFIAPDRMWLRDYVALEEQGLLPAGSDLPELVERRLQWDTLAELGYGSSLGRTLKRARVVAVGVDRDGLSRACGAMVPRLEQTIEEFRGFAPDHLANLIRWIALGVLRRMRDRGAIGGPLVEAYLGSGGSSFKLSQNPTLQEFGPRSPLPVFPAEPLARAAKEGIEPLIGSRFSWYQSWTAKVLANAGIALSADYAANLLRLLFKELESEGLIASRDVKGSTVYALSPARFFATARTAVARPGGGGRDLVVAQADADLWRGAPGFDLGERGVYERVADEPPTSFRRRSLQGSVRRIAAAEHTALLDRSIRDRLQQRFAADARRPGDPNLLSATPTLELGIDIGDLSTVVLCSVPPTQASFLQRLGRAGRRDGNAFSITVAAAESHDLYFYAEPAEMLRGAVNPPDVFLNAPDVLKRQLTAFCLDNWSASGVGVDAVPRRLRAVLENVDKVRDNAFPYTFFRFASERAADLLDGFLEAFGEETNQRTQDELRDFLLGDQEDKPPLEYELLNRLDALSAERKAIRLEADRLKRGISMLERQPDDEATAEEIKAMARERAGLLKLLAGLGDRDTFNFLTDEGLLPNYAFPEEGVTLRSVIMRTRQLAAGDRRGGQAGQSSPDADIFEYMRPAAAALSELAPANAFYAGGNHVRIDRIDLNVSEIEQWRFCPNCPHCSRTSDPEKSPACPRCGEPLWADEGQVHPMVRLRLVHAAAAASKSRIVDDSDVRQPLFFQRHLVPDVERDAIQSAFGVERPDLRFGFEYARPVTFREMNFGRLDASGPRTRFAGLEQARDGFRICRRCGKVQSAGGGPAEHTRTCPTRRRASARPAGAGTDGAFALQDGDRPENPDIVDCLYLYREFQSEAIRMLLPAADLAPSGQRLPSFIAALELGLRRGFGGAVDHLRVTVGQGIEPETGVLRDYLVLYDTVPGGTGYLTDLMADARNLMEVFRKAERALQDCRCKDDPSRDGCYRCVFAYRHSRDMEKISRRAALEILRSVLAHADELRPVENLEKVRSNALSESRLEDRFIEALKCYRPNGTPAKLRFEIVRGKPGWLLTVDGEAWYVEPQVDLGRPAVAEPSRPDFLLRPARPSADGAKQSVAVFLDGFEYHRASADEDSLKRMALVRAGYLQWSLTWGDLDIAFDGSPKVPDLLHPNGQPSEMIALQKEFDAAWAAGARRSKLRMPSFELLMRYLAEPDSPAWRRTVFTDLLGVFDQSRMLAAEDQARFRRELAAALPAEAAEAWGRLESPFAVGGRGNWRGDGHELFDVFTAVPLAAVQARNPDAMFAAVRLHDGEENESGHDYRAVWNGVLRLFNVLQFLPGAWWTTTRGLQRGLYPEAWPAGTSADSTADEWFEALEDLDEALGPLLRELRAREASLPEIGYELGEESGATVAEAEAAWPGARVAVLRADQQEFAGVFRQQGWTVFGADADPDAICETIMCARN